MLTRPAAVIDAPVPAPDEVDYLAVCDRYLPLVEHAVAQYASRLPGYVDRDDLSGAAVLGLVEAARRFDPGKGVPFEAWALTRVRGAILDAARAADSASRRTRREGRRLESVLESLGQRLGHTPTDEEIIAELGVSLGELADLRARVYRGLVMSLDSGFADAEADGGGVGFAEVLVDADMQPLEVLERRELDAYVRDCVASLPDRLRWVVEQFFFEGRPAVSLAEELGVSESRVSQLRSEAMRLLKEALGAQYAELYAATAGSGSTAAAVEAMSKKGSAVAKAAAARSSYAERLSAKSTKFL